MIDVPGWVHFVQEYGLAATFAAIVAIYIGWKAYTNWIPRAQKVFRDQENLIETREAYKEDLKELIQESIDGIDVRCEEIAQETSEKYWKKCHEQRCPKIDELASRIHKRLDAMQEVLGKFAEGGAVSRAETQAILNDLRLMMNEVRDCVIAFITNLALVKIKEDEEKGSRKGGVK